MATGEAQKTALAEKVIVALVLMAVGVLFCLQLAGNVISIVIGVAMCLYGAVQLVLLLVNHKSMLCATGLLAGVLMAVGIAFIVKKLLTVFVATVPFILLVVGAILLIDALVGYLARKDLHVVVFALELLVGVACVALGLCLMLVEGFKSWANVVFGVVLIVSAALQLVALMPAKKRKK